MTTLPTSLSNLNLTTFNKIYPLLVQKYSTLVPDPNANTLDKINSMIDSLNSVGKLSNDVVDNWNKVMAWVMNDGLTTDVSNKLDAMVTAGTFDTIFQKDIAPSLGDITQLQTTDKSNLTNALNEVDQLAKSNQTNVGTLSNLQTTHKTDLVSAVNDNVASLAAIANIPNAVGDGITDDTTALQNFLNNLNNNCWVLLPKTYKVSKLILSGKNNIRFIGNGSILQFPTPDAGYTMQNPLSNNPMITLDNCQDIFFDKGIQLFPVNEGLYATSTTKRVTFNSLIDGQSTSKYSGLFFAGDGLDFDGIIRNCGVLPVWNGTQNPYSTCNGLHVSIGANVSVKGEIYNNGMNGFFAYASKDITIDKSAHIHGNGMSGVQIGFANANNIEQKRYKIAGTIHDNYADGVDLNNASGSPSQLSIEALIDGTIQYNNGFMGANVTQDGSGIATLKHVSDITIGSNNVRNCAGAGLYVLDVNNLKIANLQALKVSGHGEGAYFESVKNIEIGNVDINTPNEGIKFYGTVEDFFISQGSVISNSYGLALPTSGFTPINVKINKLKVQGTQPVNGMINLKDCKIVNTSSVGVVFVKDGVFFEDCEIIGQTLGVQTNGYNFIKFIRGSITGNTNVGMQLSGGNEVELNGTYIESLSGGSAALQVAANGATNPNNPRLLNLQVKNGAGGNSILLQAVTGAVYMDNNSILAGPTNYGSIPIKNLQWA